MPFSNRIAVITRRGLAVVDGHLLVPQELSGLGSGEANLGPRGALVAGPADRANLQPVLRGQIVSVHGDAALIAGGGVADDVQGPVAVNVAEAQAVIDRCS